MGVHISVKMVLILKMRLDPSLPSSCEQPASFFSQQRTGVRIDTFHINEPILSTTTSERPPARMHDDIMLWKHFPRYWPHSYAGLILGLSSANERHRYKVTPSLIGRRKPRISPVMGIHPSPVDSPKKGQWWEALHFLLCTPVQAVEHAAELPLIWDAKNVNVSPLE